MPLTLTSASVRSTERGFAASTTQTTTPQTRTGDPGQKVAIETRRQRHRVCADVEANAMQRVALRVGDRRKHRLRLQRHAALEAVRQAFAARSKKPHKPHTQTFSDRSRRGARLYVVQLLSLSSKTGDVQPFGCIVDVN